MWPPVLSGIDPSTNPQALMKQALALRLAEMSLPKAAAAEDLTTPTGQDAAGRRALALNNLAVRLLEVGRRDDALNTATEAVTTYRQLAEANPGAFLPDLATSLNNLANFQSAVGRRDDALNTATEAVTLRRQLAEANPGAFLPNLATSLNNLARMLRLLERPDEADAAYLTFGKGLPPVRPGPTPSRQGVLARWRR
jgi:tetratricopeptide (TPR) repeat protein